MGCFVILVIISVKILIKLVRRCFLFFDVSGVNVPSTLCSKNLEFLELEDAILK
jgi:hypothetical protein